MGLTQTVARYFDWKGGKVPKIKSGSGRSKHIEVVHRTLAAVEERGVKLVVTWVKGHNGTGDTKSYLNTQVDRMAGKAREAQEGMFSKHPIRKERA